jgi:hypothetical protein
MFGEKRNHRKNKEGRPKKDFSGVLFCFLFKESKAVLILIKNAF